MEEVKTELIKQINKKYLFRFKDSTGKVSWIGGGRIHKKLGVGGFEELENFIKGIEESSNQKEKHILKTRGCEVVFLQKKKYAKESK